MALPLLNGTIRRRAGGAPPAYAGTLTTGLEAYYTGAGVDLTGNQVSLTAMNGATTATGLFGPAMGLVRASSQYWRVPSASAAFAELPGTHTQSMWFKATTQPATVGLVDKCGVGTDWRVYLQADGRVVGNFVSGSIAPLSTGSAGSWVLLVIRYDGTTLKVRRNDDEASGARTMANTSQNWNLGMVNNVSHFDGVFDQVCVWNRALTDPEVEELFNSGAGIDFSTGI